MAEASFIQVLLGANPGARYLVLGGLLDWIVRRNLIRSFRAKSMLIRFWLVMDPVSISPLLPFLFRVRIHVLRAKTVLPASRNQHGLVGHLSLDSVLPSICQKATQ